MRDDLERAVNNATHGNYDAETLTRRLAEEGYRIVPTLQVIPYYSLREHMVSGHGCELDPDDSIEAISGSHMLVHWAGAADHTHVPYADGTRFDPIHPASELDR